MYVALSIIISLLFLFALFYLTGMFSEAIYHIKNMYIQAVYKKRVFKKYDNRYFMLLEDSEGEGQRYKIKGFFLYRLTKIEYSAFRRLGDESDRKELVKRLQISPIKFISVDDGNLFDDCYVYGVSGKVFCDFLNNFCSDK